jgi:hypothetical protein
MEKFK